ncbi:protein of unknown function [Micropruina glycogenica]|uniref:Uncharacterized protein n=1 Tax=Micropruina glycogenica TaxID=75385 RepID=A0A2N9JFU8_9ACTN|nr:protein of unknown function [Micropruina glycogenica]
MKSLSRQRPTLRLHPLIAHIHHWNRALAALLQPCHDHGPDGAIIAAFRHTSVKRLRPYAKALKSPSTGSGSYRTVTRVRASPNGPSAGATPARPAQTWAATSS